MRGVYVPKFSKIYNFEFPLPTGTVNFSMPNFTSTGATCRPRGAKNLKIGP